MKPAESTPPIRLLIVRPLAPDNHALDDLLALQKAITVVAEVPEIAQTAAFVRLHKPDVIVLHTLSVDAALHAIRGVLSEAPTARLLLVTHATHATHATSATRAMTVDDAVLVLEHGARGLLPASDVEAQGLRAIRAVHAGEIWGSRALLSRMVHGAIKQTTLMHAQEKSALSLTHRESEIAALLRSGASNKQIAAQLRISDKTVKTHLQNIFGKMQIHRRQHILPALLST